MSNDWLLGLRPSADSPALVACCAPATVAAAEAELGRGPVAWVIEAAAHAVDESLRRAAGLEKLRDPRDLLRGACESCLLTLLRALRQELPAERLKIPAEPVSGIRDLVHVEIPLDRVLRMMWTSHVYAFEQLLTALEQTVGPNPSAATVRRITDLVFAYLDVFTENAAEEYEAERERWLGSVMAARRRMIDDIVAGAVVNTAEAEEVLGLCLTNYHRSMVLWAVPRESAEPSLSADRIRRVAGEMAQAVSALNSLTVPGVESALWTWLSWKEPPPTGAVAVMREKLPPDLRIAVGSAEQGLEGFRRTHLRAREAERISRLGGTDQVCDYAEIAVVSMLTAGPEQVHWFIEEQLGALAGTGEKLAEIRETLRLYLTFGRSRIAAAEQMHIAVNTVAYRVKRAEEVLGRELADDELQLRLALDIVNVLPDEFSTRPNRQWAAGGTPPGR